jgi:hypothetical protein
MAESGSRNVTRDINHVNNSLIFVIFYFIAQGTKTGEVVQSRAYQKTVDTICVQPAFLWDLLHIGW